VEECVQVKNHLTKVRHHHWPFKDLKKRNIQFAKFPSPNRLGGAGASGEHISIEKRARMNLQIL
jgi:hypothetical protein